MKPDMNKTKSQGTAVDLIGGPIMKNLLIFMLPILISYVFQQLYNAVDTAIVGHFLGEQSLAAVGANVAIFERSRWETASVSLCPERTGQEMIVSCASLWQARL